MRHECYQWLFVGPPIWLSFTYSVAKGTAPAPLPVAGCLGYTQCCHYGTRRLALFWQLFLTGYRLLIPPYFGWLHTYRFHSASLGIGSVAAFSDTNPSVTE